MMEDSELLELVDKSPEQAFIVIVENLKSRLSLEHTGDRRIFAMEILGALEALEVDIELPKLYRDDDGSLVNFYEFEDAVTKNAMKFRFRRLNLAQPTSLQLSVGVKDEVSSLIDKIRKIVRLKVTDENKKEAILKKLSKLQLEIDKDRTTLESFLAHGNMVTKAIGEYANNIEPLLKVIEKFKNSIWEGAEKAEMLEAPTVKRALPAPPETGVEDTDDIPF